MESLVDADPWIVVKPPDTKKMHAPYQYTIDASSVFVFRSVPPATVIPSDVISQDRNACLLPALVTSESGQLMSRQNMLFTQNAQPTFYALRIRA